MVFQEGQESRRPVTGVSVLLGWPSLRFLEPYRESGPIEAHVSPLLFATGSASLGHMSREAFFFNPVKRYSVESEEQCPICAMWLRMPHHKRFSTPISVQETEEALAIGYWVRDGLDDVNVRLCQKHSDFLDLLDGKGEAPTITRPATSANVGPVTNGNLSTSPPPVPMVKMPAIVTVLTPSQNIRTEDIGKRTFKCPLCHKFVAEGEVHAC
jgi:hypothetical protein